MVPSDMASAFHLVALPVGPEDVILAAALEATTQVEPGETIFFSETLAETASASGVAYVRMVRVARERDINIVATLNLGGELAEDLPGHVAGARYHALVIFTRHGHVHVPQAKIHPDAAERTTSFDPEETLPISAYGRTNLVRLDMDEQLIEVRFLIGADVSVLTEHTPRALACDVLVAQARLPRGAEAKLLATLTDARTAGVASTTLAINGHGTGTRGEVLCVKLEEPADAGKPIKAKARWTSPLRLSRRLYRHAAPRKKPSSAHAELARVARDPKRAGRIPVLKLARATKVELGTYPVTIVL